MGSRQTGGGSRGRLEPVQAEDWYGVSRRRPARWAAFAAAVLVAAAVLSGSPEGPGSRCGPWPPRSSSSPPGRDGEAHVIERLVQGRADVVRAVLIAHDDREGHLAEGPRASLVVCVRELSVK